MLQLRGIWPQLKDCTNPPKEQNTNNTEHCRTCEKDGHTLCTCEKGQQSKLGKTQTQKKCFEIIANGVLQFDLNYPKCYQLSGFLQFSLFQDTAPFFKFANYLKFEKESIQEKDNGKTIHSNGCNFPFQIFFTLLVVFQF